MNGTILVVIGAIVVASVALRRLGLVRPAAARAHVQQGARIIDVRTEQEYRAGHLPGTLNIPLGELQDAIARHAPDKAEVLLLHCYSGARSGMGCRILRRLGYLNVHNLGAYERAKRVLLVPRA